MIALPGLIISILILCKITYSIWAYFYLVYLSLKSPTLISFQLCLHSSTSYLHRYSSYCGSVKSYLHRYSSYCGSVKSYLHRYSLYCGSVKSYLHRYSSYCGSVKSYLHRYSSYCGSVKSYLHRYSSYCGSVTFYLCRYSTVLQCCFNSGYKIYLIKMWVTIEVLEGVKPSCCLISSSS